MLGGAGVIFLNLHLNVPAIPLLIKVWEMREIHLRLVNCKSRLPQRLASSSDKWIVSGKSPNSEKKLLLTPSVPKLCENLMYDQIHLTCFALTDGILRILITTIFLYKKHRYFWKSFLKKENLNVFKMPLLLLRLWPSAHRQTFCSVYYKEANRKKKNPLSFLMKRLLFLNGSASYEKLM